MVLVDERWLEHMYRKHDSNWKKPVDQSVKTKLNRQMNVDLNDQTTPEDLRVKKYNQNLTRFLHTKHRTTKSDGTETHKEKNSIREPDDSISTPAKGTKSVKRLKKKQLSEVPYTRPKRVTNIPKKFSWEGWR